MKEMLKGTAKGAAIATIIMAVIIMVQMALTYAFSFHIGEVFSRVSVAAVFYYSIIKLVKIRKSEAAAQ